MANGKVHKRAGALVGALTAASYARDQAPAAFLLETLGGIGGGVVGAKLPDVVDPPTSGRHRSIGHGIAPTSAVAVHYAKALPAAQNWLRAEALRQQGVADSCDGLQYFWHALLAVLCSLGAGAIAGLLGGYVSHLALDAVTPMGLPAFI